MVIVAVVVSIVLLFNMLATSASAPELVRNLKRLNEGSWQDAFNLSLLLQNPDNIDLKQDKELAAELISVLRGEIKQGKTEPTRIRLRMFVCKCLGEFTIEDPIEYIHRNQNSLVHQRELYTDVPSFADAVRASLREDPDVLLVGEMRDAETIRAAVTAAVTGHIVFSTLLNGDWLLPLTA